MYKVIFMLLVIATSQNCWADTQLKSLRNLVDSVLSGKWRPDNTFVRNGTATYLTYQKTIDGFVVKITMGSGYPPPYLSTREIEIVKQFSPGDISYATRERNNLSEFIFQPISTKYGLLITSSTPQQPSRDSKKGCVRESFGGYEPWYAQRLIEDKKTRISGVVHAFFGESTKCEEWSPQDVRELSTPSPATASVRFEVDKFSEPQSR